MKKKKPPSRRHANRPASASSALRGPVGVAEIVVVGSRRRRRQDRLSATCAVVPAGTYECRPRTCRRSLSKLFLVTREGVSTRHRLQDHQGDVGTPSTPSSAAAFGRRQAIKNDSACAGAMAGSAASRRGKVYREIGIPEVAPPRGTRDELATLRNRTRGRCRPTSANGAGIP